MLFLLILSKRETIDRKLTLRMQYVLVSRVLHSFHAITLKDKCIALTVLHYETTGGVHKKLHIADCSII